MDLRERIARLMIGFNGFEKRYDFEDCAHPLNMSIMGRNLQALSRACSTGLHEEGNEQRLRQF